MFGNGLAQLDNHLAAAIFGVAAMNNQAQGLDGNLIHKNIDLDQLAGFKSDEFIIHRRIAMTDALEQVVEVIHNLSQRGLVFQHHAGRTEVFGLDQLAAAFIGQFHKTAERIAGGDNLQLHKRLPDFGDNRPVGQFAGRINALNRSVGHQNFITDCRCRLNDVDIIFPLKPFLYDFHVQQTQESAAESKSQRLRILRGKGEAGIIDG